MIDSQNLYTYAYIRICQVHTHAYVPVCARASKFKAMPDNAYVPVETHVLVVRMRFLKED